MDILQSTSGRSERKKNKTKEAEMQGKKEHIEKAYISVLKKKNVLNKYFNQTWSLRLVLSSYIFIYIFIWKLSKTTT